MDKALKAILEWILKLISFSSETSNLSSSLENFSPELYKYSVAILNNVSKPIGFSILALFFALELNRIAGRVETGGGGMTGFEMVFKSMIRLAICKLVMDQVALFMKAIMDITVYMTQQISNLGAADKGVSKLMEADKILEPIKSEGTTFKMGIFMILIIALIVTAGSIIIVQVVVNMRFIELYAYLAMSPIPIATFPSDEWSTVGKNFMKTFAGTALQGTLIFMVMQFYPFLLRTAFSNISGSGSGQETFIYTIVGILGNSVLLIFAIMATGRWSKSITNSM